MDKDKRTIYLTFDDGPHPCITPEVLDILDDFQVKASFFCVGKNVDRYPQLFERTKERGHLVGNHTYQHLDGYKTTTQDYLQDVKKANKLIESQWFRPPYGRMTPGQIRTMKSDYQLVMWDFMTYDYRTDVTEKKILNEIKKRTRNGSIVLFHDSPLSQQNIRKALPKALHYWLQEGYNLQTFNPPIV